MRRGLVFGLVGAVILVIILGVAVALFGGNNTTPTDNTLTIWSPFDESETYQTISEQFLADNPNVKLSFRYVQAADAKEYEAKVVDAIANGKGPDIWLIRTDWLAKHQPKLVPSTDYVDWGNGKQDQVAAAAEYFGSNIAAQNSRDGALYGFPLSVDSLALYLNTKVISDARNQLSSSDNPDADKLSGVPATWSDVITWSRLLTSKDSRGAFRVSGLSLGTTSNSYAPVDVILTQLAQYGGRLFTDDETGVGLHLVQVVNGQTKSPGTEALTLFSSFARSGDDNYAWSVAVGDPVKAFVNNQLGMMIGYSSLSTEIQKLNKDFDTVTIAPLPQVNDPSVSGSRVDGANYWTHVVSKFSDKPDLAWQYLKALGISGSRQYAQLTAKPSLTASQDASVKLSTGSLGETDLFAQQAAFGSPVFKPDWQAVDEVIQDMINQALLPNQSISAAIDSAAERLKALLP